jgi:two-component system, OmpR family, sensor histidine kinase MprB
MTIRRRLSLAAAAAAAVAFLLASVGAYLIVRANLRGQIDDSLRERLTAVEAVSDRTGGAALLNLPLPQIPDDPEARFGGAQGIVQVVLPDGEVHTVPPGAAQLPASEEAVESASGDGITLADQEVAGERLRVGSLQLPGGEIVQVARPLEEVDSALQDLLLLLALLSVGGIGLAAALGAIVSRTSLAPVRRFTTRTEAIADRPDFGERLPVETDDELGRLARSFNSTLDALETSLAAQRRLVSDASHELRTPLTSLRANVELLLRERELPESERRELIGDVVEQLDDLAMLGDDIVELARRGEHADETDEIPLHEVVDEAIERARRHAPEIEFHSDLEPWVTVGAPRRIGRAVYNLLDNAAKWSPQGATVEVELRDGELTVRDHGPGFTPEDLPHVFDRFYRSPGARSMPGSGLGLAIVKQVVEGHGGYVSARNSPGGGAVLRASFAAVSGSNGSSPA